MPKEHGKIKYLPREKSLRAPFIIYADLECLLKKMWSCKNNPENSHGVQYALLMIQKTDAIFKGEKFVSKSFVKI